jgi:hypothetical protein
MRACECEEGRHGFGDYGAAWAAVNRLCGIWVGGCRVFRCWTYGCPYECRQSSPSPLRGEGWGEGRPCESLANEVFLRAPAPHLGPLPKGKRR